MAGLRRLENLDLDENPRITGAGLAFLAEMRNLQTLGLGGNSLTDAGLEHLTALRRLENLGLGENPRITDAGLTCLVEMHGLRTLGLGDTSISDAGLERLKVLKGLKDLELRGTSLRTRVWTGYGANCPIVPFRATQMPTEGTGD